MRVPLKWLREYVDLEVPVKEIAHRLTMAGLEVTGIERTGSDWENVVVGEVLEVRPHPDADRLRLVTVNDGASRYEVVCGAPNVARGQKIAYASLGATPHRRLDRRAEETEEGEDPRCGLGGNGLLRARARSLGRARGNPGARGRGSRRTAPFGDPRRHGPGHRHEAESCGRAFGPGRGARRGGAHRDVGSRARFDGERERRCDRGTRGGGDPRPRSLPAVHARADRGNRARSLTLVDAGAPPRGRHAADHERGRHHELRHAGARPANPRLRLRPSAGPSHHRPARAARERRSRRSTERSGASTEGSSSSPTVRVPSPSRE